MKSYFATLLLLQAFSASSTVAASKPTEQGRLRGVQPMEHIEEIDSYTEESIFTHNSNHHNNVIDAAYSSSGDIMPRQRKQRRQRKLRGNELTYGYGYGAHSI